MNWMWLFIILIVNDVILLLMIGHRWIKPINYWIESIVGFANKNAEHINRLIGIDEDVVEILGRVQDMSLRTLEAAILRELKEVEKKRSIKQKHIMQWQTGTKDNPPFQAQAGEKLVFLPELSVWVAYLIQGK